MKKRILAIILCLGLTGALIGCTGGATTEAESTAAVSQSQTAEESTPEATESEDEVWVPYDKNGNMILTDRDATGKEGAVSSTSWYASKAGLDILKKGGNAVDAAIAVAYALGVTEPYTSGIGGGGYMTLYDAKTGKVTTLDFREKAPQAATATMWLTEDGQIDYFTTADGEKLVGTYSRLNRLGGLAAAVPGEVKGMEYAFEHFSSGAFTMKDLLQPAIDYANTGFLVTPTMEDSTNDEYKEISSMEELSAYYLDEFGLPIETNQIITNPDLAKTLTLIAEQGSKVFYEGEIADAIIDIVKKYGGVMTKEDLQNYEVAVREPVVSTYRDYEIYTMAPSSSGGTHMLEILNILENFDMKAAGLNTASYVNKFAEAMKIAFADREAYMADSDFREVPISTLISKEYAEKRAAEITDKAQSFEAGEITEHGSTTSFSVLDKDGNMVACTITIGDFYGSKMAIPGYGFIMNDEMYDFDIDPESVNAVEGGKRPLSCITPTVVLYPDGTPFMTVGTPGGSRIFSVVAEVIERMIDFDMDIQEAIETVRVFNTDAKSLHYENDGVHPLSEETLKALTEAGYSLSEKDPYDLYFGGVQGIVILKDGTIRAGADPRRSGKALAY